MTEHQCSECGKPLKDPVSQRLGIGPKCWLKKHGAGHKSPHIPTPAPATHPVDPNQLSTEDLMTDTEPRREIEIVPIWQGDLHARWMVFTPSHDVNDGMGWDAGCLDIDGNAATRTVEIEGDEYTPDEARAIARALCSAADHVDQFASNTATTLLNLTCAGAFPEIDGLPTEQQRTIRRALWDAGMRWRKHQKQHQPAPVQEGQDTPTGGEAVMRDREA